MSIEKGWIGANTEKQARELLSKKFPDGEVLKIYEKISGMFSYEIKLNGEEASLKPEENLADGVEEIDVFEDVEFEDVGEDDEAVEL